MYKGTTASRQAGYQANGKGEGRWKDHGKTTVSDQGQEKAKTNKHGSLASQQA